MNFMTVCPLLVIILNVNGIAGPAFTGSLADRPGRYGRP
jgi:hypothetical protein